MEGSWRWWRRCPPASSLGGRGLFFLARESGFRRFSRNGIEVWIPIANVNGIAVGVREVDVVAGLRANDRADLDTRPPQSLGKYLDRLVRRNDEPNLHGPGRTGLRRI